MARYEYVNETSYKTPIPYHFTCNYCGEVCNKSYEITININAQDRSLGNVKKAAGKQHDKQVNAECRKQKKAIDAYRKKLLAGKHVTDKKLEHIYLNSECDHCGKHQMWNPTRTIDRGGKKITGGEIALLAGLVAALIGFFGTLFTCIILAGEMDIPLPVKLVFVSILVIGIAIFFIRGAIDNREEAAWFKADCMNEPNDPEKLPVID